MFDELGKKRSRWRVFWPDVSDMDGAEEAINLCSWFAFANATLGVIGAMLVITSGGAAGTAALGGPVLMVALGLGVRVRWRSAAVIGAVLLGLGIVVVIVRLGLPGIVDALTFVAFLSGVRGTFAFHRLRKIATPSESEGAATG